MAAARAGAGDKAATTPDRHRASKALITVDSVLYTMLINTQRYHSATPHAYGSVPGERGLNGIHECTTKNSICHLKSALNKTSFRFTRCM